MLVHNQLNEIDATKNCVYMQTKKEHDQYTVIIENRMAITIVTLRYHSQTVV